MPKRTIHGIIGENGAGRSTLISILYVFYNAGSGFWALDPAGDVKMLFTPNLHQTLKQLWSDSKFLNLVTKLGDDAVGYKALNTYLFEESLLNVYGHQRRFFAAKNQALFSNLNFAITSPAPWQVFKAQ